MSWTERTKTALQRLNAVKNTLNDTFIDREVAVDLLILASVCHEHLLLIGSPGTAKTQLVAHYTRLVDASTFHYLLTRFTEPSELFGPLDLERFKQGDYHIRTDSMLPTAQIAFLDEVFQGSSAILNSLLTLLNERIFHNGSEQQVCPLFSLVGAANVLPDDYYLHAFADRFVLRLHIDPVADQHLDQLIARGWELEQQRIEAQQRQMQGTRVRQVAMLKIEELLHLHSCLREVDISAIQPIYGVTVRELRAEGINFSDRRVVQGFKLVAGAALLRDSTLAEVQDLWPLNHIWGRSEEAESAKNVIQAKIEEGGGSHRTEPRSAAEIMDDIIVLENQEQMARTEVAIGAQLMALNRIRHEILNHHRQDQALRQRIEAVIQTNMNRLEQLQHV